MSDHLFEASSTFLSNEREGFNNRSESELLLACGQQQQQECVQWELIHATTSRQNETDLAV